MTAVKTRVGLLYQHSNTEECKRVYNIISNIKTALTSRCPGVDISADVVVDDNKGLLSARAAVVGSRPSDHYFRSVCLSVCLSVSV